MTNRSSLAVSLLLLMIVAVFASARFVSAADATTIADRDCLPEMGNCLYKQICDKSKPASDPKNQGIIGKPCKDPHGVTGTCTSANICKATSALGSNGKGMNVGDLSSLMNSIGSIMKALGGGSSGGGGSGGTPTSPTGSSGCTQYYQVTTPSSDPCAYYVPQSVGNSINLDAGAQNTSNSVGSGINDLGSGTNNSNSNPISNLISDLLGGGNTNTGTSDALNAAMSSTTGSGAVGVSSSTANGATGVGPGGANGEIRILPNGATIVITNQNSAGNTVTAGFLGAQTTGGAQPTGIAASWCRSRPWASNFLSFIIPATFFDSLCSLKGFQVGESTFAGGPAQIGSAMTLIHNPPGMNISPTTYVSSGIPQSPPMSAQIWAVPPRVPLGGRTTVFWNSKNAASCEETSPDGSFSHSSLSGGGATVPLAGATTFTISCMAPDGTHTTADVIVGLAL